MPELKDQGRNGCPSGTPSETGPCGAWPGGCKASGINTLNRIALTSSYPAVPIG
jgi:hypothetical protein